MRAHLAAIDCTRPGDEAFQRRHVPVLLARQATR
jgi:hypothetical protein